MVLLRWRRERRGCIVGRMLVQSASGRPTQACQGAQEAGAKALLHLHPRHGIVKLLTWLPDP